jgi:hypothetical protein
MRKLASMSIPILAVTFWLTATRGLAQTKDYWELVDTKTSQLLGDYASMEGLGNNLSDTPTYERFIMDGLGCSPRAGSGGSSPGSLGRGRHGERAGGCKIASLYIDPAADGTPSGRALAAAVAKALKESGRVKLVTNRKDADAVFACHDELNEATASRIRARMAADATSGRQWHYIAYVADGDCGDKEADITYRSGNGETEQETVTVPWANLALYAAGTNYYLAAQKHDSSICEISVEIYSIDLTTGQASDLEGLGRRDQVSYIHDYGSRLRTAISNSGYGIAEANWTGEGRR